MIHGPPTLYRLLRDYLVLKEFKYEKHPDTNRIMNGLARCFFTDKANKALALRSLETTLHSKSASIENRTTQNYESERKVVHNISQRFKDDDRCSGNLKENVRDFSETMKALQGSTC